MTMSQKTTRKKIGIRKKLAVLQLNRWQTFQKFSQQKISMSVKNYELQNQN
jgi:hypothetical protein